MPLWSPALVVSIRVEIQMWWRVWQGTIPPTIRGISLGLLPSGGPLRSSTLLLSPCLAPEVTGRKIRERNRELSGTHGIGRDPAQEILEDLSSLGRLRSHGGVGKSKVMRCTRNEDGARLNVMLNGKALEEVDQFKYLGSVIAANAGVEAVVRHRVNEGCKVLGALKGVMKNRGLGMNVKKVLYEKVVVPMVMYGSDSWGMKVTERQKLNVFEMKCLRSMTGVSRLDRVRNEVVRARTGVRRELAARVDMNVLTFEMVRSCGEDG